MYYKFPVNILSRWKSMIDLMKCGLFLGIQGVSQKKHFFLLTIVRFSVEWAKLKYF